MQQVQSLQSSAVKLFGEMQSLPNRFVQQALSGFCGGQVPETGTFAVCVQRVQGTEIVFEAEVFLQRVGRDGGISHGVSRVQTGN